MRADKQTLLLIADLITRQQVKSVFSNNTFIRNSSELEENLTAEPQQIIVDLANTKIDIDLALEAIHAAGFADRTLCFYPHVQVVLAKKALELGFENVQIRSKFFKSLKQGF